MVSQLFIFLLLINNFKCIHLSIHITFHYIHYQLPGDGSMNIFLGGPVSVWIDSICHDPYMILFEYKNEQKSTSNIYIDFRGT